MGEWSAEKSHHVSRWAVILHLLIVTWNTAMVRGEFKYLNIEFNSRWNNEFDSRTVVSNGRTPARIQECMNLCLYICNNQSCSAVGWCDQICFFCKTSSSSKCSVKNEAILEDYNEAWKLYNASLGCVKGSKALFLASPAGVPFKGISLKGAAQSPTKSFNNVTEAYAYLDSHQELVTSHKSFLHSSIWRGPSRLAEGSSWPENAWINLGSGRKECLVVCCHQNFYNSQRHSSSACSSQTSQ